MGLLLSYVHGLIWPPGPSLDLNQEKRKPPPAGGFVILDSVLGKTA
jgi:hypothetical protein